MAARPLLVAACFDREVNCRRARGGVPGGRRAPRRVPARHGRGVRGGLLRARRARRQRSAPRRGLRLRAGRVPPGAARAPAAREAGAPSATTRELAARRSVWWAGGTETRRAARDARAARPRAEPRAGNEARRRGRRRRGALLALAPDPSGGGSGRRVRRRVPPASWAARSPSAW